MKVNSTGIQDGNIEIDGHQFYAEDLTPNQSQATREIITTNVMNGTSVNTQGDYIPLEWKFNTHLFYVGRTPDYYNSLIADLESKPCEVVCPDIGDVFTAKVRITRSPVLKTDNVLSLAVTLTEIPDVTDYYIDNSLYSESRMTIYEARVVQEKEEENEDSDTENG